jgi:hypothetical protein
MLLAGLAGSGKNESISSLLKNPDGEVKQNGDTLTSFNREGSCLNRISIYAMLTGAFLRWRS